MSADAGALRLQQRLADAGDVAVPEDAEAAGDRALLDAVALGPLVGQERHDGLGDGESHARFLSLRVGHRQPRVDVLVGPGAADPAVRRVVADQPLALARTGHHVEVVEVVTGRGHRRAVPAVRDQHDVAGADLGADVDRAVRVAVHPLVARPRRTRRRRGDLEVVDLLQRRLALADLVVLVRRVRRPVAARGEHLAGDQPVALEGLRRAEVVDLPAGLPGAAQLDRHVLGRAVAERQPPPGPRRRQREPARRSARAPSRSSRAARRRSR